MKKASSAKNKKVIYNLILFHNLFFYSIQQFQPDPVGQQRITNFFTKLSLKKSDVLPSTNEETKEVHKQSNGKPVIDNGKNKIQFVDLTDGEDICAVTSLPKSTNNKKVLVGVRKSPKKQITSPVKQNPIMLTDDNSLDDDFVVAKKLNVATKNKSVYEKLDVKYVEKTSDKENKVLSSPNRIKKSVTNCSPPLLEKKNSVETLNNIFETTPDKTLLQKDKLSDEVDEKRPTYCTSLDNPKKRKFESTDSPDFIPATPYEDVFTRKSEIRRSKSKLRIENKFTEEVQETTIRDQSFKIIKRDDEDEVLTTCVLEDAVVENMNNYEKVEKSIKNICDSNDIENLVAKELEPIIPKDKNLTPDPRKNYEAKGEIVDDFDFDDGWNEEMDKIFEDVTLEKIIAKSQI